MKRVIFLCGVFSLIGGAPTYSAVLDFDSQGYSGPSTFVASSPVTVDETIDGVGVNLSGGTVLSSATFGPANQSSVYATANVEDFPQFQIPDLGYSNPLTVNFSEPINNFFLDVGNGLTTQATYSVSDNVGNSATFDLPSNLASGLETIGFAAAGDQVEILALPTEQFGNNFDFFIDNLTFNEPLPGDLMEPVEGGTDMDIDVNVVPLPAGMPLLLGALGLLGYARTRRRK